MNATKLYIFNKQDYKSFCIYDKKLYIILINKSILQNIVVRVQRHLSSFIQAWDWRWDESQGGVSDVPGIPARSRPVTNK